MDDKEREGILQSMCDKNKRDAFISEQIKSGLQATDAYRETIARMQACCNSDIPKWLDVEIPNNQNIFEYDSTNGTITINGQKYNIVPVEKSDEEENRD